MKRGIILISLFLIGLLLVLIQKPTIETDILKSILKESEETETLININKKSNSDINVIFESEDYAILDDKRDRFCKQVKEDNLGEIISTDNSKYVNILNNHPKNFLTENTRTLLKNKKYDEVSKNSMNLLYNPMGIPLVPLDKDPYLLVTDYVNTNFKDYTVQNDKFYSLVKIKSYDTGKIISLAKEYDAYAAGTPVHSYKTAKKSAFQINIFCLLATLFILGLCHYIFKSYKIFFPIIASILFGYLSGFIATGLIFKSIHVLTLVFATTLIGIGIDYSLHYYSHKIHDREFYKNLTSSMLTTVIAFLLLLIPDITLLNQISVFTIAGLICVYLFVVLIYPVYPYESGNIRRNLPCIYINKKVYVVVTLIFVLAGFSQIKTDDSISSLYNPDEELIKAEILNQSLTNPKNADVSFIIADSSENEEAITDILNKYSIDYICTTKFIPSEKKQRENIRLVNELYQNNLSRYGGFLTPVQRSKLLHGYNATADSYIPAFRLDEEHSIITAYNLKPGILNDAEVINIQKDISGSLHKCRKNIEPIIPVLFCALFLVLYVLYRKMAVKIIIPPLIGVLVSLSVAQLFGIGINIFSILSIFLIIGFTIDYSIFKSTGDKDSNIAVFSACASTLFSFLLLSFASFKLISSLGILITVGIAASYISSCVLFDDTEGLLC